MGLKTPLNSSNLFSLQSDRVVNFKGLRRHNFIYIFMWIIYYAWVVSFETWWTASPYIENIFSIEIRSLIHSIILISSTVFIFVIQKEWFVKMAHIGAVVAVLGIGLFLIGTNVQIQLFSTVIVAMALGCVNISIFIPFVFILNNTEKLYAVACSNVLIVLISFFNENNTRNGLQDIGDVLISSIMLVISFGATLFFKKDSLPIISDTTNMNTPTFHSRIYLTLFFNCIFVILCKGVGKGILNMTVSTSQYPVLIWYYIGELAGCLIYFIVYTFSKRAFIWVGNIAFSCFAMGLFFNTFTLQIPELAMTFASLLGIGSTVGMINMYYIIGVIGKKYNSMHYLRLSILFIGMWGGIFGVAVGIFIENNSSFLISMIVSIVSVALMLLFIMLSSIVSQSQYYDDWGKDSENMEIDNEQLYLFHKYNLSKREIQVCKLLLQGYTMRQISGILSIAYSTVNTYCTSAYRKLEINSKTELLILFKEYSVK